MTVKEMRNCSGLSQQKFGDLFHISAVNIGHWEQGVATPPPYVTYMMQLILEYKGILKKKGDQDETNDLFN